MISAAEFVKNFLKKKDFPHKHRIIKIERLYTYVTALQHVTSQHGRKAAP